MKSILIASALLAALTASAQAACSTAALAGKWNLQIGNNTLCQATVSTTGAVTGSCGAGTIALTSACRWTGTVSGIAASGRTEALPTTSGLKPNLLLGYGPSVSAGIIGYRN